VIGALTIRHGRARQTKSGKWCVPAEVYRGGSLVTVLQVTSTLSSLDDPARLLTQFDPSVDRDAAKTALAEVLGRAVHQAAEAAPATGPTVREVVADRVPKLLQLSHRTARGLWSEAQGGREVSRAEVVTFTPSVLIDECAAAADVPRDSSGNAIRPDLVRAVQGELAILWSDLCCRLPLATGAELGADTEAGRRFREAMTLLWTRTATFEVTKTAEGDRAARASLVSRVRTAFAPYRSAQQNPGGREPWREVQGAFSAWWRPSLRDGELVALLALRWELVGQIGQELPGVTDQASLTRLGTRYGVLDPEPGVGTVLSGGTTRLAVLAPSFAQELLENPAEWAAESDADGGPPDAR
jgi:hypothetical protein